MTEKQKEAVTVKSMASRYAAINAVYDQLPERFKLLDLLRLAKIKDGPQSRAVVASVLRRDFRCLDVATGANRVWKKPFAGHCTSHAATLPQLYDGKAHAEKEPADQVQKAVFNDADSAGADRAGP